MVRASVAAALMWVVAGAAVAQTAAPMPSAAPADSQAAVGPTGSMYQGNNVALAVPDDGSMRSAAASSGTAGSPISGQITGGSDTSAIGGGN